MRPPTLPVATRRLVLRPVTVADAEEMAAYYSLDSVCRFIPFEPMGAAELRERIEARWGRHSLAGDGDAIRLAAVLGETGVIVGDVMLRVSSLANATGELGYAFHPEWGGRGLATEAAHAVLHVAFDDVGMRRVTARVDAQNAASLALCERLGMRREGYLVENEWFKERWSDEVDFALLSREWPAVHEGAATAWCPVPAGASQDA